MDVIERDMMLSMINILKEATDSYYNTNNPIMDNETYDARLADLKEFENESGVMFTSSPNCNVDLSSILSSIVKFKKDYKVNAECSNVEDVIKFSNKSPMVVYPNLIGDEMVVLYIDGNISAIQIENALIDISKINNLPYSIDKDGAYVVEGKIINGDKLKFFVNCVIDEHIDNIHNGLSDVESLNFDVVPHWLATNLDPKKLQGSIDFVFEYIDEEELRCDGVAFRFNNIKDSSDVIVYKNN